MLHKRDEGLNGTVSGLLLVMKAKIFNVKFYPAHEKLERQSKWSSRWLTTWKKRPNIKKYIPHRQSGSAVETALNVLVFYELRLVASEKDKDDIYNFDETDYYYCLQLDRTLAD